MAVPPPFLTLAIVLMEDGENRWSVWDSLGGTVPACTIRMILSTREVREKLMIPNLREKIVPASPLDAVLSECFRLGDPSRLDIIQGDIPRDIAENLVLAINGEAAVQQYLDLVKAMASNGLSATILSLIDRALPTTPWHADIQAKFFNLRAAVEDQSGMRWAAAVDRRISQRLTDQINRDEELPVAEDSHLQIVDAWNQPDRFATLSTLHTPSELLNDPLRDPILSKRVHFSKRVRSRLGTFVDFSFFVLDDDDIPVLQVECDTSNCTAPLRCRESPILMVPFHAAKEVIHSAVKLAIDQLLWISTWVGTRGIQVELDLQNEAGLAAAPIIHPLVSYIRAMARGSVSLSRSSDEIIASYSQNHRRSISKGGKYINIHRFCKDDPRAAQCYDDLHAKIGRDRALDTSNIIEMMKAERYCLYGAYRDESAVGMVGISRHGNTAYYSAGIMSGPDNIPIGHAMIHRAIEDAKSDGFERFDFGLLDISEGSDAKMKSIARFKLGFCDDVSERLIMNFAL